MPQLSTNLTLEQLLTKWSSALNPVLANLLIQGQPLTGINLIARAPVTINHGLGRNQIGWIVTDQNASATIYRTQPFNSQTITLQSSADVTVNLWNF